MQLILLDIMSLFESIKPSVRPFRLLLLTVLRQLGPDFVCFCFQDIACKNRFLLLHLYMPVIQRVFEIRVIALTGSFGVKLAILSIVTVEIRIRGGGNRRNLALSKGSTTRLCCKPSYCLSLCFPSFSATASNITSIGICNSLSLWRHLENKDT